MERGEQAARRAEIARALGGGAHHLDELRGNVLAAIVGLDELGDRDEAQELRRHLVELDRLQHRLAAVTRGAIDAWRAIAKPHTTRRS